MQFDFNEQYKHYSDTELLKIRQQPDAYQPEALEAAVRILKERGITEEKVKTLTLQEDTTHLLDSFDLKEEIKPPPLLVFFLVMLAVEYLWKVFNTVQVLSLDMVSHNIYFILVTIIDLAYIPFVFFLLLKRKSWGWILIFISTAMVIVSRVIQFDMILRYVGLDNVQGLTYIAITLLKIAFAYYLWRKEIQEFFHVTKEIKFWTTVVAICILVAVSLYKISAVSGGINSF